MKTETIEQICMATLTISGIIMVVSLALLATLVAISKVGIIINRRKTK